MGTPPQDDPRYVWHAPDGLRARAATGLGCVQAVAEKLGVIEASYASAIIGDHWSSCSRRNTRSAGPSLPLPSPRQRPNRLGVDRGCEVLVVRIWEAERKTILSVTHDIDEAVQLAGLVLVMSRRPATTQEAVAIDLPRLRARKTITITHNARCAILPA